MGEVYVEGKRLDVFEGFKFSFNYSIADIRHPDKRSTNYSKTIQCPGTQNNDEIFGQIYDFNISNAFDSTSPNIEVNFNPNKIAEASIQKDGVEVMRGSLQLRKIRMHNSNYVYEVVFVGKLINIFGVLGDKQLDGVDSNGLRYIDFSDLDHTYNRPTQEASWTAGYGSGYVYPMIDYGHRTKYTVEGWRWYSVTDLKPTVYAKDIIDRIFGFAGFTYTSSFLSSAFFARLIVPFSKLYLKESVAESRKFKAVKTEPQLLHRLASTHPNTFGNEQYFTNWGEMAKVCFEDETILGFDNADNYRLLGSPGNLYGNQAVGNYIFFSNNTRADNFNARLDLQVTKNYSPLNRSQYQGTAEIVYENGSSGDITILGTTTWTFDLDALAVGQSTTQTVFINGTSLDTPWQRTFYSDQVYVRLMSPNLLEDGTTNPTGYTAQFRNTIGTTHWLDFRIIGGYFENEPIREGVYEGNPIDMNLATPKVSMADFFKSIINMFNLYVYPDPLNDTNLLIETRDDFYTGGEVRDWTHKVDYSKEVSLEPLALLTGNEYEYTYKEDGDYYNERYMDTWSHVYGRARVDVDNDFLNKTNATKVVFSQSPLVNDGPSNRIIPKIYDADIEEGAQPTDHNIRILYYAGMLLSEPKWYHATDFFADDRYPEEYPYAGHLTHPLAPAQDINFGIPNELFYSENQFTGTLLYTNDNLFNRYHRRGLLEVTNKDSKLLMVYMYLTPLDIHKLDFRNQIVIDNSLWRINRVMDYNPFGDDLTKVELIKIIVREDVKAETFAVGTGGTIGGGGTSVIEKKPTVKRLVKNGNASPLFGGVVRGRNNTVQEGVTGFMINGNRNRVETGAEDVTIIGDDNVVREGVTRVRLINTNGVTVTQSGTTIINNREEVSRDVLDGGEDTVRSLRGGTNIFTVDGGEDIVQAQFSETSIYLIEGNGNTGLTN